MGGWVLLSDAPPATSPFPPLSPPLSTAATPFLRSPPLHAPEAEEDEAAAAAAAAACSHCATVVKAEMASSSFCASSSAEPDRVASLSGRGGGGGGRLTPVLGSPARAEALAACLRWRASFFGSRLRCGVWARFLTVGDGVGRREGCGRCECGAGRGGRRRGRGGDQSKFVERGAGGAGVAVPHGDDGPASALEDVHPGHTQDVLQRAAPLPAAGHVDH
jgi:hypothetical protein